MKQEKIEIGKIVGLHGVKGKLRVQPWCDSPKFFCNFKTIYINNTERFIPLKILSSVPYGNIVIVKAENISTVEEAEKVKNMVVYINRKDLILDINQYLVTDIIGCEVFDFNTKKALGTIVDVSKTGANDVWHIFFAGREYLIPVIPDVVIDVDIDKSKVFICPLKGIFN